MANDANAPIAAIAIRPEHHDLPSQIQRLQDDQGLPTSGEKMNEVDEEP
jgi:hypothetical protein